MADKKERFRVIAERRTNKVLNTLRLLGQCSNRRTYDYADDEVKKIYREIDRELRRVKENFNENHNRQRFKL